MKELNTIQCKLSALKNKTNDFGGFSYRSLEGILAAVKPHLQENECTLTFSDDIVNIGNRYYVKSTATLKNKAGETESAVAFAREPECKPKMDESQTTGSASSYSRKYAACSLLAIDDSSLDPDSLPTFDKQTYAAIECEAAGKKASDGKTSMRDAWIAKTKPTKAMILAFDEEVKRLKELK